MSPLNCSNAPMSTCPRSTDNQAPPTSTDENALFWPFVGAGKIEALRQTTRELGRPDFLLVKTRGHALGPC
jgi:hypothetical protein